jgi:hypothetical protein
MANYRWISTGYDSACDALQGDYEYLPSRPHPNCRCEIQRLNQTNANRVSWDVGYSEVIGSDSESSCYRISISGGTITIDDPESGTGSVEVDYEIECLDSRGAVIDGESGTRSDPINVQANPTYDELIGDFFFWIQDVADELVDQAGGLCPACPLKLS